MPTKIRESGCPVCGRPRGESYGRRLVSCGAKACADQLRRSRWTVEQRLAAREARRLRRVEAMRSASPVAFAPVRPMSE